jgi:hypothetical protein
VVSHGVVAALRLAFPHVRLFLSAEGFGMHLLASLEPIPQQPAEALLARLPEAARRDLSEWLGGAGARAYFTRTVRQEVDLDRALRGWQGHVLTDDRPLNEYHLLRTLARP